MAIVFLGLGSNLGDREANIQKALTLLKENEEINVLSISNWIETDPEGGAPQGKFLNGALKIKTDLLPLDLLSQTKMIERRCGRVKAAPNSPRTLDIDILFYDDVVILEGKTLTIPHPRLASRRFVLEPMIEIAPDFVHPRLHKTMQTLYGELQNENRPQFSDA